MKTKKPRQAFDPVLSFPEADQAVVKAHYQTATAILEYGSGGSTIFAAEIGKPVISVESDGNWAIQMNGLLAKRYPSSDAKVVHVDIGKTGAWGKPFKPDGALNYHQYPMSVWDRPGFKQPDVILIDGRFRTACFCTALMRLKAPTTILFDDYKDRENYHTVERLLEPVEQHDRLAVFHAEPMTIPADEWGWIVGSFFQTSYTKK